MTKQLFVQAMGKFLAGLVLTALLLFLPAGTLRYRGGWLLIALLFLPMFLAGLVMMVRKPELLRKRLNAREREDEQKTVVALSGLMFAAAFIAAGLNHRFGWLTVPGWLVRTASVLFLAAYLMYAEVLRENEYLSRTVEVRDGQKVVDTGLYGVIRHPMYTATLVLFLSMGPVLGSPVSFIILLGYIPIIVKRIRNEERVLVRELEGYAEYRNRVRYRLIPFLW
ncbi:MAG: isoprenylcysteine carboxylmethyltransferase family protein [Oscillospiraceae bacterium]|nr:isoprenylcysteine carboxylmethyltransferase family protein [Oscillospiraceae bacterium]